ncbi:MAG: hypothetical protein E7369_05645 [Clostridiales bacterium]|nr:hypothetical protein [Clostridiales bacterium]
MQTHKDEKVPWFHLICRTKSTTTCFAVNGGATKVVSLSFKFTDLHRHPLSEKLCKGVTCPLLYSN